MRIKGLTPLKAIRLHCLQCANTCKGVRTCESRDCNLYIYRMGKNPARVGIGGAIGAKGGQFQMKNADSTKVSHENIIPEGVDKNEQDLSANKLNSGELIARV